MEKGEGGIIVQCEVEANGMIDVEELKKERDQLIMTKILIQNDLSTVQYRIYELQDRITKLEEERLR